MGAQQQQPQDGEPGYWDRVSGNPLFNMGMGILASNQGHYGATAPALGRGAMLGLESLRQNREMESLGDYRKAQRDAAQEKLQRQQRMQDMWGGLGSGQAGGGGGNPALLQMAVEAGMAGDSQSATKLLELAMSTDPAVQGRLAMAKELPGVMLAGQKARSEAIGKGITQFREVGGRLISDTELARLEQGYMLADGDPHYGAALAIEAPKGFDPTGLGPVTRTGEQAVGIPQMMPATLQKYGHTPETFKALSPTEQARIGKAEYDEHLQKYGDPTLAWAAYNWGPGNVDSALGGLPPDASPMRKAWAVYGKAPKETQDYMERASAYAQVLQQRGRPDPLRVPSEAEKVEQAEMAKLGVEELKAAKTTLAQTDAKLGTLQVMGQLLDQINTGRLQPTITDIKSWADGLGMNLPGIERLAPAQAFDALSKQMVLKARNTADGGGMPGAMSDADREFLRKMVPGLEKTKGANRLLLDITQRLTMRERQIAQLRSNYAAKYNTLRPTTDPKTGRKVSLDEALMEFRDRNRLFDDEYVNSILGAP